MPHPTALVAALTAALAALPAAHAGMYTKNSPVLQVDGRSYSKLIAKSNHTSVRGNPVLVHCVTSLRAPARLGMQLTIVEFYAPWCGHCQNLKPAYEKAARNLAGLAKVAAIDCDDDANKQLCGSMGVQGFPTLKIVRPSKKPGGRPVVEDYQGARTAGAITEAVASKINNHVVRVADKDLESFLEGDGPKVLLFTEKGTTSALLRSVAIDYLDVVSVGQVRNKEKAAVEKFGVEKFPTLVLIPGAGKDPITYDGELNKKDIAAFLSQVAQPNPDPAPNGKDKAKDKPKAEKKDKKDKKQAKSKPEPSKEAEPEESAEASTATTTGSATQTHEVVPIATVTDANMLVEKCLLAKSHTCVLALVPSETSSNGDKVVASLSQLNTKYLHGHRHLFPFFAVPSSVGSASALKDALEISGEVELIALNARRGWWRRYEGDFGVESVEGWIDMIRMGEGAKNKLPKEIVMDEVQAEPEAPSSSTETAETRPTDAEPEEETEPPEATHSIVHEEL
ncbi:putative protein disulfide isomerase-related protein A [Purpureocillium lavendulum]|uniref:protein disulfide-isomerase n=1 Tax=Purpureocillium lavendulum TaxID=1247861 RepID=A0AB34FTA2_9HYPO|nr:putative protein disulfide isomerase-related protein A [Purpureocillium lavendulum]